MCGIVAYIGPQNATPIIMNGLKRLEYRGYDSAGIATIDDGIINIRRDAGKLIRLQSLVSQHPLLVTLGLDTLAGLHMENLMNVMLIRTWEIQAK